MSVEEQKEKINYEMDMFCLDCEDEEYCKDDGTVCDHYKCYIENKFATALEKNEQYEKLIKEMK